MSSFFPADLQYPDALRGTHWYHFDFHDACHPPYCAELLSPSDELPESSHWWFQLVLASAHVMEAHLCAASASCTCPALDLVLLPSPVRDRGQAALGQPPSSLFASEKCETLAQRCHRTDL